LDVAAALWRHPRLAVSALVLGGYVGMAFAAHDVYPFSRFDMYSQARSSASRVVARTADGQLAEIERFDGWACDGPVDVSPGRCGEPSSYFYTPYIDASRVEYVERHTHAEGVPAKVDVVRRIWWLDGGGPTRTTDCLLQTCTAVRR
jgi:hypothetical protein